MASPPPSSTSGADGTQPTHPTKQTLDDRVSRADGPSKLPSASHEGSSKHGFVWKAPRTPSPLPADTNGPESAVSAILAPQSKNSTPPKALCGSVKHTHDSVDMDLARDISLHTHRDIPVPTFLQLAFGLPPADYEALSSNIHGWGVFKKPEYKKLQRAFCSAEVEKDMYAPFVGMGNMILDCAEEKMSPSRKVYLRDTTKTAMEGASATRFPDVLLVPKNGGPEDVSEDDGSSATSSADDESWKATSQTAQAVSVHSALVPFEFKFPVEISEIGKRRRQVTDAEVDASGITKKGTVANVEEGQSNKRQRRNQSEVTHVSSQMDSLGCPDLFSSIDRGHRELAEKILHRLQNSGRLQLAAYASELLAARGDRSHVFGVRVNEQTITLTFYHRSAIIESEPFRLTEHPLYLAIFLTRFQGEPSSFGFNRDIGFYNPFDHEDTITRKIFASLEQVIDKTNKFLDEPLALDQMEVGETVDRHRGLLGRGTSVRDVTIPGFKGPDLVIKSAWQNVDRPEESKNIAAAREVIGKHAPELYATGKIGPSQLVDALVRKCKIEAHSYERRELRILVMRKCKPLSGIEDSRKFKNGVLDIAQCLHLLFAKIEMLHQDISMNNLAYYEDDEFVVVLLDFDLAWMPELEKHVGKHRTGTAPFMARELLDSTRRYWHKVYHDLESLFYCIVWHAVGYRRDRPPPKRDPLKRWRKGSPETMLGEKRSFMEQAEVQADTCKNADPELGDLVYGIWLKYNAAWSKRKEPIDYDGTEAVARKAQDEALARGLSEADAEAIYLKRLRELHTQSKRDSTLMEGLGITYTVWMAGAGKRAMNVSGCSCC